MAPEEGAYQSCIFSRRTPWRDRFRFRLHGDNIRLLPLVEAYLQARLAAWRMPAEE